MSSIIKAVSDLFQSVLELLWSFVSTAGQLVEKTAAFTLRSFNEVVSLVLNFFKGLVDLAGGLASFILGKLHIDPPCPEAKRVKEWG
jgi:phage-related protein